MPETVSRAAARLAGAFAAIAAADSETLADMRALTEIPAPLHGEAARAAWFADRLRQYGVPEVAFDAAGNVLARIGAGDVAGPLVLAAHLDTVFGPDSEVRVRERDGCLWAPGIGDNGRGLAALLRLAAVLPLLPPLRHPLVLAATCAA